MRAAVLDRFGAVPSCREFPDPEPGPGDTLVDVRAVALENVDRAIAAGTHYATRHLMPSLPAVVGHGGVGTTGEGALVGFGGLRPPYGAMAERAVMPRVAAVPIPDGVDPAVAASVPSSALTALLPFRCGAGLEPGETVLVQGATGFSGRLAVQVAKLGGAGRVVGSGRDPESLRALLDLGADAVVDLTGPDEEVVAAFRRAAGDAGYGVVLDYVWGRPTELLLRALVPDEIALDGRRTRLVHVGAGAGPTIALPGDALRTSGLRIMGAGDGVTPEAMRNPAGEVWAWIAAGELRTSIERVPLSDVERAWRTPPPPGARVVVMP